DDRSVAAKSLAPELFADDRDVACARFPIALSERSAAQWPHAKRGEERRSDACRRDAYGLTRTKERGRVCIVRRRRRECLRHPTVVDVLGVHHRRADEILYPV